MINSARLHVAVSWMWWWLRKTCVLQSRRTAERMAGQSAYAIGEARRVQFLDWAPNEERPFSRAEFARFRKYLSKDQAALQSAFPNSLIDKARWSPEDQHTAGLRSLFSVSEFRFVLGSTFFRQNKHTVSHHKRRTRERAHKSKLIKWTYLKSMFKRFISCWYWYDRMILPAWYRLGTDWAPICRELLKTATQS